MSVNFEQSLPDSVLFHAQALQSFVDDPERISTNKIDRMAYYSDLWPKMVIALKNNQWPQLPGIIVWPECEQEILDIIQYAQNHHIAVTPYAAGSGVAGGAVPVHDGMILDVKRMSKIVAFDPDNYCITVESGINGQVLEDFVNRYGYTLGHSPSSIHCSSVAGWLAARSAGQFSSRYGKIEDLVLGIRVVFPSGILDIPASAIPAPGPDPLGIVMGSEGTLGVITQATFRIQKKPAHMSLRGFRFTSVEAGLSCIQEIMKQDLTPFAVRLYDPFDSFINNLHGDTKKHVKTKASGSTIKHMMTNMALRFPHFINTVSDSVFSSVLLIVGYESHNQSQLTTAMEKAQLIAQQHNGIDQGSQVGENWYVRRHNISYKQPLMYRSNAFVDTMEVATTWSAIANVYRQVKRAVSPYAFIMAHFSHAYQHGCSAYFSFASGVRSSEHLDHRYMETWQAALDAVVAAGATITHHHGVGILKSQHVRTELGAALDLFESIKASCDPSGSLNPGKLGLTGNILLESKELEIQPRHSTIYKSIEMLDDNIFRVGAGISVSECEAWLNQQGQSLGQLCFDYPPALTMGEALQQRFLYRMSTAHRRIEQCIISLEGVLPNGEHWSSVVSPRTAAGPDLRELFYAGGKINHITVASNDRYTQQLVPCHLDGTYSEIIESIQAFLSAWYPQAVKVLLKDNAAKLWLPSQYLDIYQKSNMVLGNNSGELLQMYKQHNKRYRFSARWSVVKDILERQPQLQISITGADVAVVVGTIVSDDTVIDEIRSNAFHGILFDQDRATPDSSIFWRDPFTYWKTVL